MIKFEKSIKKFKYCLSFDLAKAVTGWSLVDWKDHKIIASGVINTSANKESYVWQYFRDEVNRVFKECKELVGGSHMFITKEKLPNQAGKFTTAATLQALAQAHAVFDLCLIDSGLEFYDFNGMHPLSEKAYFRKITGIEKPSKDDICKKIKEIFCDDADKVLNNDVSDSIAVVLQLVNTKYNDEIDDEIRRLKREIKIAKMDKKKSELEERIQKLTEMKL